MENAQEAEPRQEVKLYVREGSGIGAFNEVGKDAKLAFVRPTILCCGGGFCSHDKLELANGFAKRAEAIINTLRVENGGYKPYQVAAVTYDVDLCKSAAIRAYNQLGDDNLFRDFVKEQLLPLAYEDGQKLPMHVIKKSFRNIQILAHSYGGLFAQQVGNMLVDELKKHQFNDDEIEDITKQVIVISIGNAANLGTGKAKFTSINIMHKADEIVHKLSSNTFVEDLLLEDAKKTKSPLAAIKFSRNPQTRTFHVDSESNEMLLLANNRKEDLSSSEDVLRYDDAVGNITKSDKILPGRTEVALSEIKATTKEENAKNGFDDNQNSTQDRYKEKIKSRYGWHHPATLHPVESYLSYGFADHGLMLRTAAAAALNNALNNSIKNYLDVQQFIPLPPVEKLLDSPAHQNKEPDSRVNCSEYLFKQNQDFTKVAKAINYEKRIKEAKFKIDKSPER